MRNTQFIGVLNVTPDSFSDGGRFDHENIVEVARQMVKDGAAILDIGGESTGPGSPEVSLEEELKRAIPAVEAVRAALPNILISIDTWKSEVAEAALKAGANIINDVTAGRSDPRMAVIAAQYQVPYILMYSKDATPRTTRDPIEYDDVVATIHEFLQNRVEWAKSQGVKEIWVDPGMGVFVSGIGEYSYEILDRIEEFQDLKCPIVVGASRKGFLGEDRDHKTYAISAMLKGKVDYVRVHDVFENVTATH